MVRRHVLVGGLGYVGYNVARHLAAAGGEVVVVARRRSLRVAERRAIASSLESLGARIVVSPRIDADLLESVAGDVYYHLAGKISGGYKVQWEAHVGLLGRVIDAASRLGARVVYTSSILAYGRDPELPPGSVVYEEESLSDRRIRRSYHAVTKAEGERMLARRGKELGGKWAILRPGLVLGPMAYHLEWKLLRLLSKLRVYPSCGFILNVVAASDLAKVFEAAGEGRFDSKWVHVVADYHPSLGELYGAACRSASGSTCIGLPMCLAARLSAYAPPWTAAAAVGEGLLQGYIFASRHLQGFKWTPLDAVIRSLTSPVPPNP